MVTLEEQRAKWRAAYHKRRDRLQGPDRTHQRGRVSVIVSEEDERLFRQLYEKGAKIADMADLFGCDESTIRRTAHKFGLPKRRPRKRLADLPQRPPDLRKWYE